MNDVAKLYQVYINREIQTSQNEILNKKRINQKILSFLHDLSDLSYDSRCFIFWDQEEKASYQQILEHFTDGLTMLMSIGYDLRIDTIKNHTEIPQTLQIDDLFFKIYHSILDVQAHYSSDAYQNTIDDYFTLGFHLGIEIDDILEFYSKK